MMATFKSLTTLVASVVLVSARDAGKFVKTVPTISNSLVNLGKMEISIHLNGPTPEDFTSRHEHSILPPHEETDHSCACSDFKPPGNNFLTNPADVITKILRSNDLFKESTSSACCGSHEHENTVFVELFPNQKQNKNVRRISSPIFPLPFENLFKPSASKLKQVEILMFPKRKDMVNFEYPSFVQKKNNMKDFSQAGVVGVGPSFSQKKMDSKDFRLVGDMEVRPQSASVKKDLAVSEKHNVIEKKDDIVQTVTPAVNLATNDNAL